jgi:hypothetical protein
MKRSSSILLVSLCFVSSLTSVFAQEVLLGTTGGGAPGELYSIDPNTGAATPIGALVDSSANSYAVTGLAFDSLTGILYGSTSFQSPTGAASLVAINPLTGAVTFIGSFTTANNTMGDLTFDTATATLYGTGSFDTNLYTINTTTGVATAVGSSGLSGTPRGVGLAESSGGGLFGSPLGADQQLVVYSKTNGSAVTVATLSGAPFSSGNINAMAFSSNGTLYGVNVNTSDTNRPTDLVTINVTTGVISDVGASVNKLDAIAFVTVVPEPSTCALFGAGFILLGAWMFHRRRRWDKPL